MQHAVKSKVLAAVLSVMIAITFMPWYLWQTSDAVHASLKTTAFEDMVVGNTETVTVSKEGATIVGVYPDDNCASHLTVAKKSNTEVTVTADAPYGELLTINVKCTDDHEEIITVNNIIASEAKIGDKHYEELEEAIAAAKDGETVTLEANATIEDNILVKNNITIDLAGKTIRSEAPKANPDAKKISAAKDKVLIVKKNEGSLENVILSSNGSGSIIAEGFNPANVYTYAPKAENKYAVIYNRVLYLGDALLANVYAKQLNEHAGNYDYPIYIYNTESLTGVPEGVIFENASGTTIKINGTDVASGDVFKTGANADEWLVIFDAQGGKLDNGQETKKVYAKKANSGVTPKVLPEKIDPQAATKEGYIFNGWYTNRIVSLEFEVEEGTHTTAKVEIKGAGVVSAKYEDGTTIMGNDAEVKTGDIVSTYVNSEGQCYIVTANGNAIPATILQDNKFDFSKTIDKDMTLYAHWVKDMSTVKSSVAFNLDGGTDGADASATEYDVQQIVYGEKVSAPKDPVKTGFTFGGWYNGEDKWDFNTDRVFEDITLTAKWDVVQYTVEFKTQGHGQGIDPIKVDTGAYIATEPVLEEDGYIFGGWFADQACRGTKLNLKNVKPESLDKNLKDEDYTVQLFAKWTKANTYTVEFKTQGHGQGIDPVKVAEGEYIGTEPVLEEDGYIFGGWFADQACRGTKLNLKNVKPESLDKNTEDNNYTVQLFAKWTQAECNVHFDFDGGKIIIPATEEGEDDQEITDINKSVAKNSKVTDPGDPEKKGYRFLGWFKNGSDVAFDFNEEIITADTTLTAKWEEKALVTFYVDEKNTGTFLEQVYVTKGGYINGAKAATDEFNLDVYDEKGQVIVDAIYEKMDALRTGYTFLGFYDKDGNPFDIGSKIYEDTAIYGHWAKKADNTIVFYDVTSGNRVPVAVLTLDENRTLLMPEIYGDKNLPKELKASVDKIIAEKKLDMTKVTSLNGLLKGLNYDTMSSQGIYAKNGYNFVGMFTDKACENEWDFNTEVVNSNMNVYLKYEPIKYKIVFDRGVSSATAIDGEESLNGVLNYEWASGEKTYTQTVAYDQETQLIPCKYEREGYVFSGWKLYHKIKKTAFGIHSYKDESIINATIDEDRTNVVDTPEDLYLSGEYANYIFVAQWTPVKYGVVYLPNGGEGTPYGQHMTYNDGTQTLEGTAITTKANKFANNGYHFIGWNTEEDGSGQWIKGKTVNAETGEIAAIDKNHTAGNDVHHPCTVYDGAQILIKHASFDSNLTKENGATVKLYAQWAPCENYCYTVTVYKELVNKDGQIPSESEAADLVKQLKGYTLETKARERGWFAYRTTAYAGTTDESVTAKIPRGFDPEKLDEENSTPDLTIELIADNYTDKCSYEEGKAPANIDIFEKALAKAAYSEEKEPVEMKPAAKETSITGEKLVYNAMDQELIVPGKTTYGTYMYAIVPSEPKFAEDWDKVNWSEDIPVAKDAGEYLVAYYIEADEPYESTEPKVLTATIAKKPVGISWGKTSFNYDGYKHVPTATATGVCAGDTCIVYVEDAKVPMGNYTAEITGLSNSNYYIPGTNGKNIGATSATVPKVETTKAFKIVGAVLLAKATPSGSKKIKVTWTGVSGATRYVIYGINCGKATVYKYNGAVGAGTKTVTFKKAGGKKIKAHKSYKFYVQAYAGKTLIAQSNTMHCIAAKTKGKKYANPTAIYSNQGTVVVTANKIAGVSARVKLPKKKKMLGTDHVKPYRYLTSDRGIATVDAYGTVYGVHSGVCKIYTQTVNGMWCATTVIVK